MSNLTRGTRLDLRGSIFNVAVSRNKSPRKGRGCELGSQPVNRYPFAIEKSRDAEIIGGLFLGTVPMLADWEWTYCNSAALRIEDSPNARIYGQRIYGAWDAIRIDDGTQNFQIEHVWVTDTRDDCIENDHLMSGRIRNSLLDGCFAGVSVAPDKYNGRQANIEMDGVLLRLKSFKYKGKQRHNLPIKLNGRTARFTIKNSVIAVESSDLIGRQHAATFWASVGACSNNRLLWLGRGKLPSEFASLPSCFSTITGQRAVETWRRVRGDWINCNGDMDRLDSDPIPKPSDCSRRN